MLSNYFYTAGTATNSLTGAYDYRLVILSYLVASFASYIALDIAVQLRDGSNTKFGEKMWLCGGAFAMGAGIWSMHFIGMLAFSIPKMHMNYDLFWTGLSMIVAVLASGFAFILLKNEDTSKARLIFGGFILGISIATMHYVGMEAMKVSMNIYYIPSLFFLSILVAIVASEAAIWLVITSSRSIGKARLRLKVFSAFIMGAAICGMHYIGMFAAIFTPRHHEKMLLHSINPDILAIAIAGVAFIILGVAFFISIYNEGMRQKALLNARQAGKTEVAVNVLHNVGNVLNSINISTGVISSKISESRLDNLSNLSFLMEKNKTNLGHFITLDPKGQYIPDYIKNLSENWIDLKTEVSVELRNLVNHINHIKNIIDFQQEAKKSATQMTLDSIHNIIDEAILIARLQDSLHRIKIEKEYADINPFFLDKHQLLQIIVNLLQNAKESLLTSKNDIKFLLIKTGILNNDTVFIEIIDNGVGISSDNLTKIFRHGFTTKEKGHGFGLHACANTINTLGGVITVESEGPDKGAKFSIKLPYQLRKKKQQATTLACP